MVQASTSFPNQTPDKTQDMKKLRLTFTFLVVIPLSGGLAGKFTDSFSIYLEELMLLYHKENSAEALKICQIEKCH